jgi:hypothetical protein
MFVGPEILKPPGNNRTRGSNHELRIFEWLNSSWRRLISAVSAANDIVTVFAPG